MKLHEYQAKKRFAARGIPVPPGDIADTATAAGAIASTLGGPVVIKAQVLVGGRGKAGGIVLAQTAKEAASEAQRLLSGGLRGTPVRRVLVERAVQIAQELYVATVIDRRVRRIALMTSSEGGVEIEDTARLHPDRVHRVLIDPLAGVRPYHGTQLAASMHLPRHLWSSFTAVLRGLYDVAQQDDATLAEVNPLAVTADGDLLALDAKLIIDDSALYRQRELASLEDVGAESAVELQAREGGISFVKLPGYIGCMVNGAGLAMATMDLIKLCGGEPANFLDIGGGARAERVELALRLILADRDVRAILVNIFGGITRCDEVSRGLLRALSQVACVPPLIVRLVGTNEAEGRRLLQEAHLTTAVTLAEAARLAVAAAGGAA